MQAGREEGREEVVQCNSSRVAGFRMLLPKSLVEG